MLAKIYWFHTMFDQVQSPSKLSFNTPQAQRNSMLLLLSLWPHSTTVSCFTHSMLPFLDLSIVIDHYWLMSPFILWAECDFYIRVQYSLLYCLYWLIQNCYISVWNQQWAMCSYRLSLFHQIWYTLIFIHSFGPNTDFNRSVTAIIPTKNRI